MVRYSYFCSQTRRIQSLASVCLFPPKYHVPQVCVRMILLATKPDHSGHLFTDDKPLHLPKEQLQSCKRDLLLHMFCTVPVSWCACCGLVVQRTACDLLRCLVRGLPPGEKGLEPQAFLLQALEPHLCRNCGFVVIPTYRDPYVGLSVRNLFLPVSTGGWGRGCSPDYRQPSGWTARLRGKTHLQRSEGHPFYIHLVSPWDHVAAKRGLEA